ncbi:15726_t:CDS:2 [Dentiscutata erythropus]|uniref:15726_t:CDS:1 n=1 Tax=Dentiscutata erythropus TaxID=1348616 RepID=A0A9N9BWG3_9GLOM|nr:15726_t:CDS:2 [Dentiscutata erythropus]
MNPPDDLIKKCANEEHIKLYERSCFKDVKLIGEGGYGRVYRAIHRNNEVIVALKSFKNNVAIKEVVKELKLHSRVDMHHNITRLYGVTENKDEKNLGSVHYMLVLEYADNDCWKHDPDGRPDIQQVLSRLQNLRNRIARDRTSTKKLLTASTLEND